jgi:hypothetical protein
MLKQNCLLLWLRSEALGIHCAVFLLLILHLASDGALQECSLRIG